MSVDMGSERAGDGLWPMWGPVPQEMSSTRPPTPTLQVGVIQQGKPCSLAPPYRSAALHMRESQGYQIYEDLRAVESREHRALQQQRNSGEEVCLLVQYIILSCR